MSRILVVDDSLLMRKVLLKILEKAGYRDVEEARNGQEAIDVCKSSKPDLMLLDVVMPGKSGIDVLEEVKGVKTLMVTAVGEGKTMKEAKARGAEDYILKPFDEKRLISAVKKALAS